MTSSSSETLREQVAAKLGHLAESTAEQPSTSALVEARSEQTDNSIEESGDNLHLVNSMRQTSSSVLNAHVPLSFKEKILTNCYVDLQNLLKKDLRLSESKKQRNERKGRLLVLVERTFPKTQTILKVGLMPFLIFMWIYIEKCHSLFKILTLGSLLLSLNAGSCTKKQFRLKNQ